MFIRVSCFSVCRFKELAFYAILSLALLLYFAYPGHREKISQKAPAVPWPSDKAFLEQSRKEICRAQDGSSAQPPVQLATVAVFPLVSVTLCNNG